MHYEIRHTGLGTSLVKVETINGVEVVSFIPQDEDNVQYQAYLAWVAAGNTATDVP